MRFLHDKPRAGVLAVLAVMMGPLAMFFTPGAGATESVAGCTDNSPGDVETTVGGVVTVGLDQGAVGSMDGWSVWLCVIPPDQGAGFATRDQNAATPGTTVETSTCGTLTCTMLTELTGAELDPATSANAPASGAAGTGGSAGAGTGTCVFVDGTPTCPVGTTIGVTVHESDASVPTSHPNGGGCVTAAGNPCLATVPSGIGVSVLKGDSSRDTVTIDVLGTPVSRDLGDCIGYNAGPGC